jgi:hypothetical protein
MSTIAVSNETTHSEGESLSHRAINCGGTEVKGRENSGVEVALCSV